MRGAASRHSPELEAAISRAVDALYAPTTTVDFSAAGDAVRDLIQTDRRDAGDAHQQLALGTLMLDMNPPVVEGEDEEVADVSGGGLPQRIMLDGEGELEGNRVLDQEALTAIAVRLLALRGSARDTLLAYCALRFTGQTPAEIGEMHAMQAARGVSETSAVTDRMTRIFARRVLALVAEHPDDVFAAVRQAQDEGNALEVIRLVEASYSSVPPAQAMSLIGMGVNAADEMEDPARELEMYILLLNTVTIRLHELHHESLCDEVFERNPEAGALAGEFELLAEAFARFEGNEELQMVALVELAMAQALLHDLEFAQAALERASVLATANGGFPKGLGERMHTVEDVIQRNKGPDQPPDTPPDNGRDPKDDDPTKAADWWKDTENP